MPGLTVREVLDSGLIKGARLMAGVRGLDRVIRHVSYSDAPDSAAYMQGGELVLSTGYGVRDNPMALIDFIENHRIHGTAALAIKPKRFLGEIPPAVLAYAEEVGHPILDIPPETPWVDVITPVLTEILNRQAASLQRVLQVHHDLARIVLEGNGLKGVAQRLATMIGHPVAIFDHTGQQMALGLPDDLVALPADLEQSIRDTILTEQANQSGRIGCTQVRTFPVVIDQARYGYVCAYQLDRPFREADEVYLQQGTLLVALEMLKERTVAEVEYRHRWQFLDQVLAGWYSSPDTLISRGRELGFDFSRGHALAVVRPSEAAIALHPEKAKQIRRRLFEAVQMRLRPINAIAVDKGEELVVLLPVPDGSQREPRAYAAQVIADVLDSVAKLDDSGMLPCAGLGGFRPDPTQMSRTYREARQAALVLTSMGGSKRVAHIEELGVYQLLYTLNHEAGGQLTTYYQDLLGPLVNGEPERAQDLLETLEVYLRVQSVREAGMLLHVHPNTVKYRLNKIQELTGTNLDDFEAQVALYVAVAALRMSERRKYC